MPDPQVTNTDADLNGATLVLVSDLQVVADADGNFASGSATIPVDDTIPQITEGTEFLSATITPVLATSVLRLDVTFIGTVDTAFRNLIVCLFKQGTADALAVAVVGIDSASANFFRTVSFSYSIAAGSTSPQTFSVRAGVETSGTVSMNGVLGSRYFGGALASSLRITEIPA